MWDCWSASTPDLEHFRLCRLCKGIGPFSGAVRWLVPDKPEQVMIAKCTGAAIGRVSRSV